MEYRDDLEVHYPNDYETVQFENGNLKIFQEYEYEYTNQEKIENIRNCYPDYWIDLNYDQILRILNDITEVSLYNGVLDDLDFSIFSDYMEYTNNKYIYQSYDWNVNLIEYAFKMPNKKNPTFRQFVSHYLIELKNVYDYLCRTYTAYSFGPFESFCDLAYETSSGAKRLR
jgi:hypothetical protein